MVLDTRMLPNCFATHVFCNPCAIASFSALTQVIDWIEKTNLLSFLTFHLMCLPRSLLALLAAVSGFATPTTSQ